MVHVQKLMLFLLRDAMRYSAVFAVVRCPSVRSVPVPRIDMLT